jgi:glycerate kinase
MRAVAEGLQAAGLPAPDECPLADAGAPALESAGYDGRMRAARAVVILAAALRPAELPGSAAFELATRARQAGVPAYAITGENGLDSFDERILDLELVIEARTARELRAAGARLAEVI